MREIQSEKLVAAVRYVDKRSPFYRARFDVIKLTPADIKGIDDLWKIPVTTKAEMARDVVEHPPWGTHSPIDDDLWSRRSWMLFTSSDITAQSRPFRYTLFDRDIWVWADDMLNIRGLTVFPSAVEEVVRCIDELSDEFEIIVYEEHNLDCLRIVAEPRSEVPTSRHAALAEKIESEVRAKIGLQPEVELRPWGSLPKTEVKARRLRDLRLADRR